MFYGCKWRRECKCSWSFSDLSDIKPPVIVVKRPQYGPRRDADEAGRQRGEATVVHRRANEVAVGRKDEQEVGPIGHRPRLRYGRFVGRRRPRHLLQPRVAPREHGFLDHNGVVYTNASSCYWQWQQRNWRWPSSSLILVRRTKRLLQKCSFINSLFVAFICQF